MLDYRQSPLLAGLRGLVPQPPAETRRYLCHQLVRALDDYYAHLPQKRAAFAIDPVRALLLLRVSDGATFVRSLLRIVSGLRDRHTTLRFGPPWDALVAYLPFVLERYLENGLPRYVVTQGLLGWDELPVGTEVTHWNGTPIERYVDALAADNQGANPGARLQLAVSNLSIRPLAFMLMPQENWVTLTYRRPDGGGGAVTTPWRFYSTAAAPKATALADDRGALAGIDELTEVTRTFRSDTRTRWEPLHRPLRSEMDGRLRFGTIGTPPREAGYVRLLSFDVPDATAFVRRMAEILEGLPQDRLVIDVRGNPGGLISAGQKLVRLLTTQPLAPSPIAFRNTAATARLGENPMFAAWAPSLDLQWYPGEAFSQALPVTDYDDVPDYRYPGRIALITDGLCYSTTDFFAADFKDNGVGTIIGVDAATGGGGANVWGWNLLSQFLGAAGPGPMPPGYDFNVAVRRSVRTGAAAGIPVEDLGVPADHLYRMTRADVLEGNRDLLRFAVDLLSRP